MAKEASPGHWRALSSLLRSDSAVSVGRGDRVAIEAVVTRHRHLTLLGEARRRRRLIHRQIFEPSIPLVIAFQGSWLRCAGPPPRGLRAA
jgi:hypothetical protein